MRNSKTKKQFEMPTPRVLLPIGHPDRDRATLFLLTVNWRDTRCTLATWEKTVRELEQERIWERYPPDNPYGSLNALLAGELDETPLQFTLNQIKSTLSPDEVKELINLLIKDDGGLTT